MASILVENVYVSFPIYDGASRSLRSRLVAGTTGGRIGSDRDRRVMVEALSDVSFDLQHGDRIALVGHNGAGKTTLLRVLAGIYAPLQGRVSVDGRIAPLFDVALGIDPESTGYENILLRGLYLGLTRAQIDARTDEIAAFTELGPFLTMPVRTYSAGMLTRLAFAVSTSIDPDILILDEGIGAGDAAFMGKANRRLHSFIERAGIMVLASHAEILVRMFCNKALLLEHGRVLRVGSVDEVFDAYQGGDRVGAPVRQALPVAQALPPAEVVPGALEATKEPGAATSPILGGPASAHEPEVAPPAKADTAHSSSAMSPAPGLVTPEPSRPAHAGGVAVPVAQDGRGEGFGEDVGGDAGRQAGDELGDVRQAAAEHDHVGIALAHGDDDGLGGDRAARAAPMLGREAGP